jgi:hypothetical protein
VTYTAHVSAIISQQIRAPDSASRKVLYRARPSSTIAPEVKANLPLLESIMSSSTSPTLNEEYASSPGPTTNRIHHDQPLSSGVELENNNVAESPTSTKAGQPGASNDDPEKQQIEENDTEKEWIVKFDGDHDPDNPRSMSKARKWAITMVVAFSSLCV